VHFNKASVHFNKPSVHFNKAPCTVHFNKAMRLFHSTKSSAAETVKASEKKINFIFVRHGYGCHNAASRLARTGLVKIDSNKILDPELTDVGVDATVYNGCILANSLRKMGIDKVHLVGSSGLIRSMETAYYITSRWKSPPTQIYVFPYLRELDESTLSEVTAKKNKQYQKDGTIHLKDKNSEKSRQRIDTIGVYAMKSIPEQKTHLHKMGLLDKYNFQYVENNGPRFEPGDIFTFIDWFHLMSLNTLAKSQNDTINVLLVTHAGVLKDFFWTETGTEMGFDNNSGFVVNTTVNDLGFRLDKITPIKTPSNFFDNYPAADHLGYFCPSDRCGFCSKAAGDAPQKKLSLPKNSKC
jgi:broad specificity phosphatase PhoE